MKRLMLLAALAGGMLPAGAETYDALWKQATAAREKDQPRTELAVMRKIIAKAEAEDCYGQLLAAQLRSTLLWGAISPDSLAPARRRMAAVLQHTDNATLRAVRCAVLGKMYQDENADSSRFYYQQALSRPDLLAGSQSDEYAPLTLQGADGKSFDNDLLHLIGFEANSKEAYQLLHDYYLKAGRRSAACLCAYQLIQLDRREDVHEVKKSKYLQTVDSLIHVYRDLPEAGELAVEHYRFMVGATDATASDRMKYINYALNNWGGWSRMNELRNAQKEMTLPEFTLSNLPQVMRPGQKQKVELKVRSLQTLNISISRLNITADNEYDVDDAATYKLLMGKTTQLHQKEFRKTYYGHPAYEQVTDSFEISGLPLGAYLLEVTSDNTSIAPQRRLFYVSDLALMAQEQPDGQCRYVVVSATTGQPIAGASVLFYKTENKKRNILARLTTDEQGEVYYKGKNTPVLVSTVTDKYTPSHHLDLYRHPYEPRTVDQRNTQVYTDRAIYRPGQTLHASAITFNILKGVDAKSVGAGEEIKYILRDTRHKVIEEKTARTDEYGTSTVDFTLPDDVKTGTFTVSAAGAQRTVKVEEYKRPTFTVNFPAVNQKYNWGDTVVVKALARSYAGVPVQGAKVSYKVTRRTPFWWRNKTAQEEVKIGQGTTAEDGTFLVEIPLTPDRLGLTEQQFYSCARFYSFDVEAQITDQSGESHAAEMSLPLGTRSAALSVDLSNRIERDSLKQVTFHYQNAAGMNIDDRVRWHIDQGAWTECATNVPAALTPLASGKHRLEAVCGTDTLRHDFAVFSMTDTRPVEKTTEWYYQSSYEFLRDGKPVYVQVGSSENGAHVVYSLMAGNKVIERGVWELSDSIVTLPLTYKPEYESGLVLEYCFVKNGEYYSKNMPISKPLPEKKLDLAWKTFRDRLVPGQKEEWTLTVTTPDGQPAKAQLMGVLYDQSLDALAPHRWQLPVYFYQPLPSSYWSVMDMSRRLWLHGQDKLTLYDNPELEVDHFNPDYFASSRYRLLGRPVMLAANMMRTKQTAEVDAAVVMEDRAGEATMAMSTDGDGYYEEEPVEKKTNTVQVRENLNETAFFYPALQTDGKGNVSLKFTLPESLTTWKFIGLAHDQAMNHGQITAEAVAQKTVMVQPNQPRFLREGDKATVSTRIHNTSDKKVSGNVRMQLIDPETQRTVWQQTRKYTVPANGSTEATFTIDPGKLKEGTYINRVVAEAGKYSDGEQSYLPVLSNREQITNTLPITLTQAGRHEIDLAPLFADKDGRQAKEAKDSKVTVEYTNNPAWLMVQALPAVATPDGDNALSLMTALYSNMVSDWLLRKAPAAKDLMKTAKVDVNLVAAQAEKLAALQQRDGSFSWWKGMPGNRYVTTTVAELMVRLCRMTKAQPTLNHLLTSSLRYLQQQTAEEVKEMKKQEAKKQEAKKKEVTPSTMAVHYLYLLTLDGRKLNAAGEADKQYLLKKLAGRTCDVSITAKAKTAVVLGKNGYREKANDYLQSLREYTVYTPEMGRYFDTRKATYSWRNYRIPTQVAAIEALRLLAPADRQTVTEMQRWLLQSKRTQAWDTPINTADAVYAFLAGNEEVLLKKADDATLALDGKAQTLPKATVGTGYVKVEKQGVCKTLTVDKKDNNLSWGAVYSQYTVPADEAPATASGLKAERKVTGTGKVGDKVEVTLTVTADRDYDFVQVVDKRAACLEPVEQISGYQYAKGCYIEPKDKETRYYFNQLPKGTHVLTTTYYIDRAGEYRSGTCTVECTYSPEFAGRAATYKITTEK